MRRPFKFERNRSAQPAGDGAALVLRDPLDLLLHLGANVERDLSPLVSVALSRWIVVRCHHRLLCITIRVPM